MSDQISRYLQLFFELQLAQWNNYAHGARHDLNELDRSIYACLQASDNPFVGSDLAKRVYLEIRCRGLVDKHPQVSLLRNRLDDWSNYEADLTAAERGDQKNHRLALATRMKTDVLQLMQLRQELARKQGFLSYPQLVLQTEGLSLDWTRQQVAAYLERHLPAARSLIAYHGIQWDSWFSDLRKLGELPVTANADELAAGLLQHLGFQDALPRISLHLREDGLAGYTGVIQPGFDVRVLARPPHSLPTLATFFHELGHACYHALSQATGLLQTWTSCFDEAMAVLLEQVGLRLTLPEPAVYERARQISLLENVRCAISYLFEADLWLQPERAEELYLLHYGRLGLDLGDSAAWSLDSFRSLDPMYIQNYVLGAVFAVQTIDRWLRDHGQDYLAWGKELRGLYALGRRSIPREGFQANER